MDTIGNLILGFFGIVLMPLFIPFLMLAALSILAGGRAERALQLGFDLLETFFVGGLTLVWHLVKTVRLLLKAKARPTKTKIVVTETSSKETAS